MQYSRNDNPSRISAAFLNIRLKQRGRWINDDLDDHVHRWLLRDFVQYFF